MKIYFHIWAWEFYPSWRQYTIWLIIKSSEKMKFLIFITLWISSSPQYSSNKFGYISVRRNLLRRSLSSIVIKDNAKIRLSELNENLFSYMSVRILSKWAEYQNKTRFNFVFPSAAYLQLLLEIMQKFD